MDLLTPVAKPAFGGLWEAAAADLRAHCRVDGDDTLLRAYLEAAYAQLDGPGAFLGRALLTQSWRLSLPGFSREIELPLPPLRSVDAIAYIDPDGAPQAMAVDDWRIVPSEPARMVLRSGSVLPATSQGANPAVTITFSAGYGVPADLPAMLRVALFEMAASAYENREPAAYGTGAFQAAPTSGLERVRHLQVVRF